MNIPIAGTRYCEHTHLSGRSCGKRVHTALPFCGSHKHFHVDGSTVCAECAAMLEVFPIRKRDVDGIV